MTDDAAARTARPQDLTPRAIVEELDRYIVGQKAAKRAVAVALRNRWRRQQVPPPMRDEIAPKNIMLIGPTGVGKTEIARRLAQAGGGAVRQGRGLEVHRGRLRRPRRRLDGARSGRDRGVDAARGGARAGARRARARTPRSACSTCCCRRRRARARRRPRASTASAWPPAAPPAARAAARQRHAREPAPAAARREARRQDGRDRHVGRAAVVHRRVLRHRAWRRWCSNLRDMLPQGARRTKRRRLSRARGAGGADRRGGGQADRPRAAAEGRDPPRRAGRHHLHRRDRQGRRARSGRRTARTSRARACSATCCRSSRARR